MAAERRFATQLAVAMRGLPRSRRQWSASSRTQPLGPQSSRGCAASPSPTARDGGTTPASGETGFGSDIPNVQTLREDHAALTAYIAGRRAWWDEMQSKNSSLAARRPRLEHELAASAKRLAAAEAFAVARSRARAVECAPSSSTTLGASTHSSANGGSHVRRKRPRRCRRCRPNPNQ